MDPYASPEAGNDLPIGDFSVADTVSEAVSGFLRNVVTWILVMIVSALVTFLSICPGLVVWIVAIPLMTWGIWAFALQAVDGRGEFASLFSGSADLVSVTLRMWGYFIVFGVLYALLYGPPIALIAFPELEQMVQSPGSVDNTTFTVKSVLVAFLVGLPLTRLWPVLPLMIERKKPLLEALSESWQLTSGHWLKLMALFTLVQFLALPAIVVSIGMNQLVPNAGASPDLAQLNEMAPLLAVAYLFAQVLNTVVAIFGIMLQASVYRQLTGPAPEAAAQA